MRPWRSTWVASTTTRPAPELDSMPRWVMCQSLPTPSSALYWHIGETTTRLGSSRPGSLMGENNALDMVDRCFLLIGYGVENAESAAKMADNRSFKGKKARE